MHLPGRSKLVLFAACILMPVRASAGLIDFEGLGPEGAITFISGTPSITLANANLIRPGNPRRGFNGASSGGSGGIDDANSGNTLGAFNGSGLTVSLVFSQPVTNLRLDAVDIEAQSFQEFITAQIFDAPVGGNLLDTITINEGDPGTGDGLLTPINFGSATNIWRLEFRGLNTGLSTPGYAVDNLSFEPIPEPGSSMVGIALAFVATSRCRRPRCRQQAAGN
jgi:hypothetical protein